MNKELGASLEQDLSLTSSDDDSCAEIENNTEASGSNNKNKRKRTVKVDSDGFKSQRKQNKLDNTPKSYQVPLTNKFECLQASSSEINQESNQVETNQSIGSNNPENSLQTKPPPITVVQKIDFIKLSKQIKKLIEAELIVSYTTRGVKIVTKTLSDYNKVKKFLDSEKIEYFTFPTKAERTPKVVLKGLPPETDEQEIMNELVKQNYPVVNIRQLRKTTYASNGDKQYTQLPIWILTLMVNKTLKDFENLRSLWYFRVKMEEYQNKEGIPQCYNCQAYGHKAGWCTAQPKCMRCAQNHSTKDCAGNQAALCTNCLGRHTANDKRCPKYPKQDKINTNRVTKTPGRSEIGPGPGRGLNSNVNSPGYTSEFPGLPKRSWNSERTGETAFGSSDITELLNIFKDFDLSRFMTMVKTTFVKIRSAPDRITKLGIVIESLINYFE